MDTEQAVRLARSRDMDLVLVNPQGKPPVAKIIEWSKFKYEQSKKKKKSKSSDLSEIRIKPFIDVGDLAHKLKKVQELLGKGNKVKFTIQYKRGAEPKVMQGVMNSVLATVEEYADVDGFIRKEGRNLAVYLVSKQSVKKN